MNLTKIVLSVLFIHCQIPNAWATNFWFMPGDACFPVVLDKQLLKDVRDSDSNLHFQFRSLRGGGYFCGYAGYNLIEIQDAPKFWSQSLHEIYSDLRSQSTQQFVQKIDGDDKVQRVMEDNGFLMFVQNRAFDIERFQVGFLYNEDWMNAFPGRDSSSGSITHLYQPHFRNAVDVIEDWGNSKRVDGLKVQIPVPEELRPEEDDDDNEFTRRFGKGPLIASGKDLMLIILPCETLESHRSREERGNSESAIAERRKKGRLITVDAEGIRFHHRNNDGKYRSIPWIRGLKINESSFEE